MHPEVFILGDTLIQMKHHIPNILTLLNLFCALPAIESALSYDFHRCAFWMGLSLLFDFSDGFAARVLKSDSRLGLQLDSLADVVSFGVVPSFILYKLIRIFVPPGGFLLLEYTPYLSFLIAMGAAYRLARFNLDSTQSGDFKGLPTPSAAVFVMGIPFFIDLFGRENFRLLYLIPLPFMLFWIMNSDIRLFALKSKKHGGYFWLKGIFLFLSIALLFGFGMAALSFIILLYIMMSIVFYHPNKANHEISS